MKKIICYLLGHKRDPDYNDCGFSVCMRCGSHEYYDQDLIWIRGAILKYPYRVMKKYLFKITQRTPKMFKDEELPF